MKARDAGLLAGLFAFVLALLLVEGLPLWLSGAVVLSAAAHGVWRERKEAGNADAAH